ncbi:hypothetical protein CAEBREN_24578 [Caenorhabditis brenneri]|uniref:T-box domain-containing protein n=1 Tax=Caenorhabditis brenneri TaxID=135651 RepID=G0MQB0_CAEBE|nr:hypothetical protein CAEBREN_24578 [Caenorhabditis brenneri]
MSLSAPLQIQVSLRNKDVFDQFSSMLLEQVICKTPRIFFPMPHFDFSGLESGMMYKMGMRFDRISNEKYTYSKDLWQSTKNVPKLSASSDIHWTDAHDEKRWTKSGVQFKVHVSSHSGESDDTIQLESRVLYQAVLLVHRIGDGVPQEFKFPQLEFMAVAKYRNQKVIELKSSLNIHSCREQKIEKAKKRRALADIQNSKRQCGDSDSDDDDSQISNTTSSTSGNSSIQSSTSSTASPGLPISHHIQISSPAPDLSFNHHVAPATPPNPYFNYLPMAPGIQNIPPAPWGSSNNSQPMTPLSAPYGFTDNPNPVPHPIGYPPAPMAPRYPDPVLSPTDFAKYYQYPQ